MRWFGASWGADICAGPKVSAPVGEPCSWCEEAIALGDRGVMMPTIRLDVVAGEVVVEEPMHIECLLRSTLGSIGHLTGTCSCVRTVRAVEDPPGLTRRQAALEVAAWVSRNSGVPGD